MPEIKKPTSAAACTWWGGNTRQAVPCSRCLHPMLWMRMRERSCAKIRVAGHCPYGRTPLDNNESGKDENDEI